MDKVSALALHSTHRVLANISKVVVDEAAAETMPDMQNLGQHDCSLLRLPTELRLEIFRLAFQEYLDTATSSERPYYRRS